MDIGSIKLFLLLHAEDMTIFSETAKGLQERLNVLESYCNRWKLTVNINKTKVMVFLYMVNLVEKNYESRRCCNIINYWLKIIH